MTRLSRVMIAMLLLVGISSWLSAQETAEQEKAKPRTAADPPLAQGELPWQRPAQDRPRSDQQISARDGRIGQVDIRRVIDDSAIRLPRHPLVKTTVAGLHMENRYLAALSRNHRKTAVGITKY